MKNKKFEIFLRIVFIIILIPALSLFNFLIKVSMSAFIYMYNGLSNYFNSDNILMSEYVKTDVDIEYDKTFFKLKSYNLNYEVDGVQYSKKYFEHEEVNIKYPLVVFYNINDPSDSFAYNETFKFTIYNVFISFVLIGGCISVFIIILVNVIRGCRILSGKYLQNKKSTVE